MNVPRWLEVDGGGRETEEARQPGWPVPCNRIDVPSRSAAFGAAASLAGLLIWIYFSAMILLRGAEFTHRWAETGGRRIEPPQAQRR